MQMLQFPSAVSQMEMSHSIEIGSDESVNWKLSNWKRASGLSPLDRIVVSESEAHAFSIKAYSGGSELQRKFKEVLPDPFPEDAMQFSSETASGESSLVIEMYT